MAICSIQEVDPSSSLRVVISSDISPLDDCKELPVILQRISFNEKLIHLSLDLSSVDIHI